MNSPFAPSGKCTVLVVDDTPDNLSLMSDLLRTDYKVKLAPSGERALQIVAGDVGPGRLGAVVEQVRPRDDRLAGQHRQSVYVAVAVLAGTGMNHDPPQSGQPARQRPQAVGVGGVLIGGQLARAVGD